MARTQPLGVPICVPTQPNSANLNRGNTTYTSAKSLQRHTERNKIKRGRSEYFDF